MRRRPEGDRIGLVRQDLVQAALAALALGLIGALSIGLSQPLLVPSLGAAILLQVHLPDLPNARPWNTAIGQLCGGACGFAALFVLGAMGDPSFSGPHPLTAGRVEATMLAVAATLLLQALLRAINPAGGATALIVSLGSEAATGAGAARLAGAILLVTALGEAARRLALALRR
jgi:CBS-domain-containing membrane protein